jgi:DNA-binding response OmpR family regulator
MRILLVEDAVQLHKALRLTFEKNGYAVDVFTDGIKAERHIILNHTNYDLIVLDYILPNKTGIEVCVDIRAQEILVPILMLTGVIDTATKVAALDAGADDYLTKPFSTDELMARVRALLRRPREALSSELSMGALTLNSADKKVLYAGKELKLTLKEFSILEYLMRNSNHVMSRDQILDHVWDLGVNAFSNIVDVHITNLRKKLEKAGAHNVLETIRGVGFTIKS